MSHYQKSKLLVKMRSLGLSKLENQKVSKLNYLFYCNERIFLNDLLFLIVIYFIYKFNFILTFENLCGSFKFLKIKRKLMPNLTIEKLPFLGLCFSGKSWKRMVTKVTYVGEDFTRKPPKFERFIRPMVCSYLF